MRIECIYDERNIVRLNDEQLARLRSVMKFPVDTIHCADVINGTIIVVTHAGCEQFGSGSNWNQKTMLIFDGRNPMDRNDLSFIFNGITRNH